MLQDETGSRRGLRNVDMRVPVASASATTSGLTQRIRYDWVYLLDSGYSTVIMVVDRGSISSTSADQ